jgi:hypothetical protein
MMQEAEEPMRQITLTFVLALALVLAFGWLVSAQPANTAGEVRHSGRIVEVAPDRSSLVLEEIVAWNGPGTGLVNRSIRLTASTAIRLVERAPWRDTTGSAMPGWEARPLEAGALRAGDYVTVTTDDDHRDVAVSLQVVRPS